MFSTVTGPLYPPAERVTPSVAHDRTGWPDRVHRGTRVGKWVGPRSWLLPSARSGADLRMADHRAPEARRGLSRPACPSPEQGKQGRPTWIGSGHRIRARVGSGRAAAGNLCGPAVSRPWRGGPGDCCGCRRTCDWPPCAERARRRRPCAGRWPASSAPARPPTAAGDRPCAGAGPGVQHVRDGGGDVGLPDLADLVPGGPGLAPRGERAGGLGQGGDRHLLGVVHRRGVSSRVRDAARRPAPRLPCTASGCAPRPDARRCAAGPDPGPRRRPHDRRRPRSAPRRPSGPRRRASCWSPGRPPGASRRRRSGRGRSAP